MAKRRLRLLLDANIISNIILARQPWVLDAADLFASIENHAADGYVAAHAITTLYYIVAKTRGREVATMAIGDVLKLLRVVPTDSADFQRALALNVSDCEDAVQVACALKVGADFVITRNAVDFHAAPVRVRTAGEALALLRLL